MLYAILKGMSTFVSWLPYKFVVRLGRNCGKLYYHIAKKQRVRAEKTIMERMGMEEKEAKETIYRLFLNLGMTFMEMLYMPALNKDNIRGLVTFDRPDVLWEALSKKKGLSCSPATWITGNGSERPWLLMDFPSVLWKNLSPIRSTVIS